MRQSRGLLGAILIVLLAAAIAACQDPGSSEPVGHAHQGPIAIAR
jgi:hypothetical protein